MSKVSSDKLFQLIKSLSQSEKRHFKLFASRYEGQGKKYLKLFDAMDLQENYDETKLLETEKYLKPSQLPNLKNYLCQLVLKSMRIYSFEKSVSSQLLGSWNDASFLFEKGFYTQCKEIITKSKKIARQHEKYWELFAFLTLEKTVANKNELIEISNEELLTLEKLKNIIEYQKLGHEFASLMYETLHPRNESEIQKYQEIANHFLLSSEKNALTYQSKLSFYWITSSYAQVKGDFECYYENSKKCLETIETNKLQLEENPIKYLNALHNFLGTCVNLKKYEEVPETLKKIRSLSKNLAGNLQIQIFARTYPIELIMYIDTAEFEKCVKLISEIDFELKKHWENLKKIDKIYFAYLICYSFYAVGNYSKALGWINKILNDKETEIREDLYCFSRILNLIIHFELEDYELLEHIVKSTHDFLVRRKKIYKFETILLNFLKKFSQVKNNKELLELFKELKTEILPLTEDIFEQKALSYFDFISWLDSKIEEKPFAQVVKNKLKQHS